MNQLTFLLAEPPAKVSPSPDSEAEWMTLVATWPSNFCGLLTDCSPAGLFGRTCPESCRRGGGGDFGSFLGGLVECGYGFAYRVLDAQFFGLAQRRKRVFVIGYFGDWRPAAAVLFERESLRWNPAPRRETRKDVAPTINSRPTGGGGLGTDFDLDGGLDQAAVSHTLSASRGAACANAADLETYLPVASVGNRQSGPLDVATAVNACHTSSGRQDFETETFVTHALTGNGFDASEDGTGRGTPLGPTAFPCAIQELAISENPDAGPDGVGVREDGLAYTLEARAVPQAVAFAQNTRDELREMDISGALASQPGMKQTSYARVDPTVRRLTPRECERLQGFPDDYTAIPYRGKLAADGPRYKALGNSMAVPVMRKIGERIAMMDATINE